MIALLAWTLVAIWALALLASARHNLRPLPEPGCAELPPYLLWLPGGGDEPPLDPPPTLVHRGPLPLPCGPEQLLILGNGLVVPADLPKRLANADAPFVSILPRPRGSLVGMAVERARRDYARCDQVVVPKALAAFADPRCAWLCRHDLELPGDGDEPILRAARARKAHGCSIDLREGGSLVSSPPLRVRDHRATVDDLSDGDPIVRWLLIAMPLFLCVGPISLLSNPDTRATAALAMGLGTATRLFTALRDSFGLPLALAGWFFDPLVGFAAIAAPKRASEPSPFPELAGTASPELTAALRVRRGAWLEGAAIPFLARRLGGAAPVMEAIYRNRPTGRHWFGKLIDRVVHQSDAARAVRHRRLATIRLGRGLGGEKLLSIPCGGAGDAARIESRHKVLADPDPVARGLAQTIVPEAELLDATVETAPSGPFDLVLYIGLCEYLDDSETLAHLHALRVRLGLSGALITSCTAEHPQQSMMTRWLGWQTRSRSADDMAALLERAGFVTEARATDPWHIQWVFLARPRGA